MHRHEGAHDGTTVTTAQAAVPQTRRLRLVELKRVVRFALVALAVLRVPAKHLHGALFRGGIAAGALLAGYAACMHERPRQPLLAAALVALWRRILLECRSAMRTPGRGRSTAR